MNILVTGGGGFIGSALVRKLVPKGFEVSSFSRKQYPELLKLGVKCFQGDLAKPEEVQNACRGIDVVFHVAAKAAVWGSYDEFSAINIKGTYNVILACKNCNVRKLIFTSSASVVFNGSDLENADESLAYPQKPLSAYTATKAIAEKMVLEANTPEFKTISLRPHVVWGPGDTQLINGILIRAKSGRLRRIGRKDYLVDTTYIDNFTDALLLAMEMMDENPEICGRPFFISNGEPVKIWDFINSILESNGMNPVKKSIPESLAMMTAKFTEALYSILQLKSEPFLTSMLVSELSAHHWFNIDAARKLLGYHPRISTKEGLELLRHSISGEVNISENPDFNSAQSRLKDDGLF
jgi:nucleoside-diphosphate-sugar epimerase